MVYTTKQTKIVGERSSAANSSPIAEMASKIQQQLNFAVRKSSRQSKPSRILREANEQKSQKQDSKRDGTPQRGATDSKRDGMPQRGAGAGRKAAARGSHSPCNTATPRTAGARRQRREDGQSPCRRDCTPHRPTGGGTPYRAGASPCQRETPKRSASARQTPGEDQDGASPCKRGCTPQRVGSAGRSHCREGTSPVRGDCTPQRTFNARRILELDPCSPSKRDSTPVSVDRSRQRQPEVDAPSPCRSPSKRKAAGMGPPPTPPKSPCKSSVRNSEQRKASRVLSPDIHSEESESDEDGDQGPCRRFVLPHNTPTKAASGSLASCGKGAHSPTKGKDGDGMAALRSPKGRCEMRSPNRQGRGAVLPPPTPPLSPFVPAGFYRRSAAHGQVSVTSRAAPSTPTKADREVQSPGKPLPTTPQKQSCEQVDSPRRNGQCTPQQVGGPRRNRQCTPQQVDGPRRNGQCTPQKAQCSSKVLNPCRSATSTPQKGQPPREVLSPRKPSSSPHRLSSPRKPSSSPHRLLSPRKPSSSPHRLLSPRKPSSSPHRLLSPRKTVGVEENEENFTLKSPKLLPKLQLAKPDGTGYQRTKQSLHTAKPDQLVGREGEVGEITDFLKTHLDQGSAGSLYISGAPGTGKTAALLHIIDDVQAQYTCRIAYLNCMMVKDVSSVFRRLHSQLSGKPPAGRTNVKDMERLITSSKNSMILVLDEIDQLDSKNQEVLYTIFEWPSLLKSKLILVGVANALDLTDRILPRLQAKPRCRPSLLHFPPYTRTQISAILHHRLSQSGESIVESSAVQLCARKVAAVAGDVRKALDVCRRAVELVESETRCQAVLKAADCNSPSKRQPVRRIGVGHVSRVMGEVYGTSVQTQQGQGLPLQQKLAVCTLLLMVHTARIKEVPLGKLHETYCKVCRRQKMSPVDQSEFHSLCVLLEARGVIAIKKAKDTRLMKISLRQDEKELEQTLKDKVLVSAILADGLPK